MSKRNRSKRWRCPACSSKNVRALNRSKDQLILQCKNANCQHKWHIIPDTNIAMALKDGDIKYVKVEPVVVPPPDRKIVMVPEVPVPSVILPVEQPVKEGPKILTIADLIARGK